MTYNQVLKVIREKVAESKSSNNLEDLDFFSSLQRTLLSKSYQSYKKTTHNRKIEQYKRYINLNLDKLKI